MSKAEWALLIGIVIFIDIFQAISSSFAIGLITNRFLNIAIGILLPFGLHQRGVDMIDVKKILFMFTAFGTEFIGIGDFLPLWTIAIVLTYIAVKGEENPDSKLGKVGKVLKMTNKAAAIRKPLNVDGVRLPSGRDTI